MMGRRTAAMLCVLLLHALLVLGIFASLRFEPRRSAERQPTPMELFFPELRALEPETEPETPQPAPREARRPSTASAATPQAPASDASSAITESPFVDWPVEAKESAARVLAAEREAERIAKMFAGPDGTWASLTKRQQSEVNHFRWKPGIDGLERDENGNTIYRVSDRCVVVNFIFIGCTIGAKPPAYGDLFKDMRKYFDEQRLPQTNEGNGTEPESKRPPTWSRPLPEKRN